MILSIGEQTRLFLATVAIGGCIGAAYDILRVFRKILPHKNIFIQIEDFFYWIFTTGFMFYYMLNRNYGEIRWFSVAGVLIGMLLYFLSASRFFIKIMLALANFIIKVAVTTIRIILFPFKLIYKMLSIPAVFFAKKTLNVLKPLKRTLHKIKKYAIMKRRKTAAEFKLVFKKK